MFRKVIFAVVLDVPGALLLIYAAVDPFFVRHIPPRPATVKYLKVSHGRHNYTLHVGYSYVLSGQQLIADESVNDEIYYSLHVGQTVEVCAFRFGPLHYVEMQNGNSSFDLGGFVALGLAWNLVFGLFLLAWIMLPRRLVRIGAPAWGRVTDKRVEDRNQNGTSYCIRYEFKTPNGETHDWPMYVSRKVYGRAVVGAQVVVLYDLKPDGSCHSLIYDYCDYVAG